LRDLLSAVVFTIEIRYERRFLGTGEPL